MAVQPLASQVGVAPACRALGVPRASFYRRQRPAPGHQQPRPTPARALCASERAHVLDVLASPRFVDRSPAEVVATLLDEGQYLCAERTMYRILEAPRLPNLQAAVLLAPPIVGLLGDAQGPAHFGHRVTARQADFSLTQLADDLFRGMSLPWHLDLLSNGPRLTFRLGQVLGGRSYGGQVIYAIGENILL